MYAQFFGLKQEPFSIAPDPRYLFMSERHREALAHLLYGLGGGGGFVLLSGEIGAGKTTVCRCFLEQIPRRCNVAYIFNPKLTVVELLQSVCTEFGIPAPPPGPGGGEPTVKNYVDPLNEFLLRTHAVGQNNVLIIDEAQNLSADVLEQLRLLTNLETNERKLLQIVLIGQPELRDMLARPELEQLAQRVIARFHLKALSRAETTQYIRHRLAIAGMSGATPFDAKAMRRIHQLARGIPRRINLLCDRALLGAYAEGRATVDLGVVEKAADEVFDRAERKPPARARTERMIVLGLGLATGAALVGFAGWALNPGPQRNAATAAGASAPARARADGASAPAKPVAAASVPIVPITLGAAELPSRFKAAARTENEAWRELGALWKLELPEAADACQAALRQQVPCWRSGSTTLALIRQLGRPGILTLHDAANKPVHALLTGLTGQSATLLVGGESQTLTLASLAGIWRGEFASLWRAPPGYQSRVVDAGWLAAQLAALDGGGAASAAVAASEVPPDEAALKARVYAFQLAQGLKPDGLAGPTTFMQLNRATGVAEPRLQQAE